jgi:G3E family GTPase
MEIRTPIVLITGSLGSGKTTLLRHILANTRERLAIVMNEFGEVTVDSRVIAGKAVQMVELTGGCVCCSLTGELAAAIDEIITAVHPDRIVLEATGVAEADALVYEVQDFLPQVRLDSVIALVDAHAAITYPQVGYTERSQLEVADLVVINKTDLISTEELAQVRAKVKRHNPGAVQISTVHGAVDMAVLLGLDLPGRKMPGRQLSPHATWQSFAFTTGETMDEECFRQVVASLPLSVFRSKGFVRLAEGTRLFNYVAGRMDLEDFPSNRTELIFIGQDIDALRDRIVTQLSDCCR